MASGSSRAAGTAGTTEARKEPPIFETLQIVLKYGSGPVTAFCSLVKGTRSSVIEVNLHSPQDRRIRFAYWFLLWVVYVPLHLLRCFIAGPKIFFIVLSALRKAAVESSSLDAEDINNSREKFEKDGKRLSPNELRFTQKNVFEVANDFKRYTNYSVESWRPSRYSSPGELAKDLLYHAAWALAELRVRGTGIQPDMHSLEKAISRAENAVSKRSAILLLSGEVVKFLSDLRRLTRGEILQVLQLRLDTEHHVRFFNKCSTGLKTGVSDLRARRVSLALIGILSKNDNSTVHVVYGLMNGLTEISTITADDMANALLCEALTEAFVKCAELHSSEKATIGEIDFLKTKRPSLNLDISCWAGSYDSKDFSYPGKVTFDLSHRGCQDLGEFAGKPSNVEKMMYLMRYGRSKRLRKVIEEYDGASHPDLSKATIDEIRMLQLSGRRLSGHHSSLWRVLQDSDRGKDCILPEFLVEQVREHLYSEQGRTVFMYTDTPVKITKIGGKAHFARADQSVIPTRMNDLVIA